MCSSDLLHHCWWECKFVQPIWKTVWRFLKKLKIELPYDPAILLLGIYPEKTIIQKDTCTPMFIAALFTIDRTWKQPKCLSTEECKIVLISPPSGKGASQNKQSNLPYFTMIQGAAL